MRMPRQTPTWTPTPCCSKVGMKRGPWTADEDALLTSFVQREGEGRWRTLPKRAGLLRCGKSCRLRWMNYLRPSIKHGPIAPDEEDLILRLHRLLGNRWSLIAGRIPGRTDNEIKNYWNTHLSKKLVKQGIDPRTHKPFNAPPLDTPPAPSSANPSNSNTVPDTNITVPSPSCPPPPPPPPPPAAPQEPPRGQFGFGGLNSTVDAFSDPFDCFIDGNAFMQHAETSIPVDPSFGLQGLWEDDFHYFP